MGSVVAKKQATAILVAVAAIALLIGGAAVRGDHVIAQGASLAGVFNRAAGGRAGTAPGASAPQGTVFLTSSDGRELIALDLNTLQARGRLRFDRPPSAIRPTPGGVSLYVGWADAAELAVYDVVTLELQARIDSGLAGVSDLSFSPTGEQLYAVGPDGTTLQVNEHQRLTLDPVVSYAMAVGAGAVQSDRRGTQLYRETETGLAVLYGLSGDVVDRIAADGSHFRFDEDYSGLWGVSSDGRPLRVDERSGAVAIAGGARQVTAERQLAVEGSPGETSQSATGAGQPAAERPAGETGQRAAGAGGRSGTGVGQTAAARWARVATDVVPAVNDSVWYLGADRSQLLKFDPTRPGRAPQRIQLPTSADYLVRAGNDRVWAISRSGSIAVVHGEQVTSVNRTNNSVTGAVSAEIQTEGNFACF